MEHNTTAVGIDTVIAAELDDIANRRGDATAAPANAANWKQECHQRQLFGVCLSGGGIRSATFALGILQGLTERDLLPKADYLSTVSGGGYIGSWLQGVLYRSNAGIHGFDVLTSREPGPPTTDPISFLRKYSDYLSPRSGLSLDAVVIPIIWIRNAALNQVIFFAAFLAAFSIILVPPAFIRYTAASNTGCSIWPLLVSAASAAVVVYWVKLNLMRIAQRERGATVRPLFPPGQGTKSVAMRVVVPLFLAVIFLVLSLLPKGGMLRSHYGAGTGFAVLWVLLAALQWGGGFIECWTEQRTNRATQQQERQNDEFVDAWSWLTPRWHVIWMSAATAGFIFFLLKESFRLADKYWKSQTPSGSANIVAWIPPIFLAALMIGVALQIGFMGRDFPDASREWLARVGALTWVFAFGWASIFAIGLFSPYWIAKLWIREMPVILSALTVWVGTTFSSVLAGKSGKTGSAAKDSAGFSVGLDTIARFGPFVAVPGILIALACSLQLLLCVKASGGVHNLPEQFVSNYWNRLPYARGSWSYPTIVFAVLCVVFIVLSLRVNINEFSMHHFYKNRLVRCFFGASAAKKREPDAFTGFDPQDDIPMKDLQCGSLGATLAPYPILNATLTVTVGSELATQERKAIPWFFTPRYSGFHIEDSAANKAAAGDDLLTPAFVSTAEILGGGVHLGTAMAISGAALNPSSGYHSAPQTSFLMTLFDVRLGWWIGNPRDENAWCSTGPHFALFWLLRELFGFVDERSAYLNLSDGGNFENLGLYELVRRRCHYVIAVDGEQDPNYAFESLGGAIRKCREDFGIEIDIDPRPIVPVQGLSSAHCVVGRIHYPEADSPTGYLLYVKASITGDEPTDVEAYRRQHLDFPQQSTTEQFFLESQFESYRRLGLHVARTAFDFPTSPVDLHNTFVHLENRWCMPARVPEGSVARHAAEYIRLLERLADSPELASLDPQILENFPFPQPPRRDSFYRIELLQLMENIFYDLGFANLHTWNHPANAGWKRAFEYWTAQKMMVDLWQKQRMNSSKPFQDFVDNLIDRSNEPPPWRHV